MCLLGSGAIAASAGARHAKAANYLQRISVAHVNDDLLPAWFERSDYSEAHRPWARAEDALHEVRRPHGNVDPSLRHAHCDLGSWIAMESMPTRIVLKAGLRGANRSFQRLKWLRMTLTRNCSSC
jgi:hypothetical protein